MHELRSETMIPENLEAYFTYHHKFAYRTVMHCHDFYEWFLVTQGSIVHVINGEKQLLHAGALVWIRPSDIHCFERHEAVEAGMLNVNYRAAMVRDTLAFLGDGFLPSRLTEPAMPPGAQLPVAEIKLVLDKYRSITSILPASHAEIRSAVRGMLADLLATHFSPRKTSVVADAPVWFNRLHMEMLKCENFIVGLDALHRQSPVSPEHLCRTVRKYFGKSPTEWINELRLQYAETELRHSNKDVIDICMEAGFNNVSYFYKLFAKNYRMSPAQYRRLHHKPVIPQ